jgi:hypothetical protein
MGIKVFWLEPTELERVWLRRYRSNSVYTPEGERIERPGCPLPQGYHDNSVLIVDAQPHTGHGIASPEQLEHMGVYDAPSNDDPRWPLHCECGYEFGDDDKRQVFRGRLYSGALDGKLYTLSDAPIGAMWDASWHRSDGHGEPWTGPDGISLVVKTPGGDWTVDSEASNCTRTQWGPKEIDGVTHEKVWLGRTHYCWIRHGDPRTGNVHVDKNGDTCAAGAGSILSGNYHGFLHNGELVQC